MKETKAKLRAYHRRYAAGKIPGTKPYKRKGAKTVHHRKHKSK